jgi:hypothetical protein
MQAGPKATTAAPIDQQNIVSLIKHEHRAVQQKASEYRAENDPDSKFTLAKQVATALQFCLINFLTPPLTVLFNILCSTSAH